MNMIYSFSPYTASQTRFCTSLFSEEASKSPLPSFDDIMNPPSRAPGSIETPSPAFVSPLVERALDSALDFLSDGDLATTEEESDEFEMFDIFEDSPDFDIPYDLIKEYENKEMEAIANRIPSAFDINSAKIQQSIEKWRRHDKDCGSPEVQIAIANEKIKYLTQHLLRNKYDNAAKRGLDTLVNTRRKFLNYLYESDKAKAEEMVAALGIRFRPPGRQWDKQSKYGAFKNTKSKWQKIRVLARQERDAKMAKSSV